jgi:uncharacterized protein YdhG (YjbR/CyaY superfamily)
MTEDVQSYFDAVPEDRRALLKVLEDLILSLYPNAEVVMWYGMPTYRLRPGWSGWVAIANWKHHIALYANSHGHFDSFRQAYPKVKTTKSCIQLKPSDPLPLEALAQVIRHAMDEAAEG